MKTYMLDLSACNVDELNKLWFNGYTEEIPCEACDGGNWEFYVRPRSVPADVMDRWRKEERTDVSRTEARLRLHGASRGCSYADSVGDR